MPEHRFQIADCRHPCTHDFVLSSHGNGQGSSRVPGLSLDRHRAPAASRAIASCRRGTDQRFLAHSRSKQTREIIRMAEEAVFALPCDLAQARRSSEHKMRDGQGAFIFPIDGRDILCQADQPGRAGAASTGLARRGIPRRAPRHGGAGRVLVGQQPQRAYDPAILPPCSAIWCTFTKLGSVFCRGVEHRSCVAQIGRVLALGEGRKNRR